MEGQRLTWLPWEAYADRARAAFPDRPPIHTHRTSVRLQLLCVAASSVGNLKTKMVKEK